MKTPSQRQQLEMYLGPLELDLVEDVWENGPTTVGDSLERLNSRGPKKLAYNTVMTTLARLVDKGALQRQRDGRAYVYEGDGPTEFLRRQAAEAAEGLVNTMGPDLALSGILNGIDGLSASARKKFRRLLEQRDQADG